MAEENKSSKEELPGGAKPLDATDDYFTRQDEFREWLRETKGKYVDELSGEKSRSYFRKFVKAWNRGELDASFYRGTITTTRPSSSNTAYRWSFAKRTGQADRAALEQAKDAVHSATYQGAGPPPSNEVTSSTSGGRTRISGPTLPGAGDLTLQSEQLKAEKARESATSRKRDREEERERIEDLVGPREVGRERMLEKKRLKREGDREMKGSKDDAGVELGDEDVFGGGDSFKARLAQRDAARRRFEEKKQQGRLEKQGTAQERLVAMREKEKATMAQFQAMARERYGA